MLDQSCTLLLDPALDDLFFSKICVIKSSVNMLWMYGWLKFSKVTSGSWCFFANYLYLQSFFKKKITKRYNFITFCVTSNMFHHTYKNKKRVSLRNWMPHTSKLNPQVCKSHFYWKFHNPSFVNFQKPHPPLNKVEYFPAMKGVLRMFILC